MTLTSTTMELPKHISDVVSKRAARRYREHNRLVRVRADRTFALLMVVQWIAEVVGALLITPRTWIGASSSLHIHVWGAILVGGAISLPVLYLVWKQPGANINRYLIGVAQVLTSALLIHLTGGRIETHFHIFGSLAFIGLYRDWRVLVPATVVAALDHLLRGLFWPESVFGVAIASNWRWLEHAGWVLFEDSVLVVACIQAQREMRELATQWGSLSVTKELVDAEVEAQVSKLAASEQRLRVSELRIRRIIDTAYDAFVVVNTSGSIIEWSARAESLFGWSARETVGRDIREVLGVADLSSQLSDSAVEDMIREQAGHRLDTNAIHRSGKSMSVEASISAMVFDDIRTLNVFFHDISARKAMQTELLHAQKMQGIGQLAAGIAHEINTPTQYAGDNVQFLMDSFREIDGLLALLPTERNDQPSASPEWEQLCKVAESADVPYLREEIPVALGQALDGIRRIGEITRAMKEFSHPGTRSKEDIDPRRIIENSATVCRNEWKYVAELKTEFDPELTTLLCLPGELSQVLVILIVNAAQAIGEKKEASADQCGTIMVRTRRVDQWAEISVEDTGSGIAPENLQRIFEPFFTTKEVGKGTGQGLAIAHSVIVEKHGGSISVSSQVGRGTMFTLRLPLEKEVAAAPAHESNLVRS